MGSAIEDLISCDVSIVRARLDYDPDTGMLTWRERPRSEFTHDHIWRNWNARFAGKTAGSLHMGGYICIAINSRVYRAHRLAWVHYYGEWPAILLDHIDGNRTNNAIGNLRECTNTENQWNRKKSKRSTTGAKGVSIHSTTGKYHARISLNGKDVHLGLFDTIEEAARAYNEAALKHRGEFAARQQTS